MIMFFQALFLAIAAFRGWKLIPVVIFGIFIAFSMVVGISANDLESLMPFLNILDLIVLLMLMFMAAITKEKFLETISK